MTKGMLRLNQILFFFVRRVYVCAIDNDIRKQNEREGIVLEKAQTRHTTGN